LRQSSLFSLLGVLAFLVLAAFLVWPEMDLFVSGLFAAPDQGFLLRQNLFLVGLGKIAFFGARVLALGFAGCALAAYFLKKPVAWLSAKSWVFLLLCLLVGPGLFANVVFKDHWGRARPREIVAFGGTKTFTPALVISDQCKRNCSFVSGDGAFGFFLPSFAYVVPFRRRRRVFWGGMGFGVLFGGARILLGAHFLSDVLYAAVLVLATSAGLHALLFGKAETKKCWRDFFRLPS